MSPDNQERAARASRIIEAYARDTGDPDMDASSAMADILADFRHLCDEVDIDFRAQLTMADAHYQAET